MLSTLTTPAIGVAIRRLTVIVAALAALASTALAQRAPREVRAAIEKANLYIELTRGTERARDSWERYASWVNLKTGPTGKERYISYGMYSVHDVSGLLDEARKAGGTGPSTPKLDAEVKRYIAAYEAVAPVLNAANDYYEGQGYRADGMAKGQALHKQMMPLVAAFLAARETLLGELRPFVRDVEGQEVAAIEAQHGRSRAWQAANVMNKASRVVDTFPRIRPTPIDADTLDKQIRALGPHSSGKQFEEVMSGVVRPTGIVIDMARLDAAMKGYVEAVAEFETFATANPEGLGSFKLLPGKLLVALQALREPLARNNGRDFEGSDPYVNRVVEGYFAMISASSSLSNSQIRFLQ